MATLKLKTKLTRTPKKRVVGLTQASKRPKPTKAKKPAPSPTPKQQKKRKPKLPPAPKKSKGPPSQPPIGPRVEVLLQQLEAEHPELLPPKSKPVTKCWAIRGKK